MPTADRRRWYQFRLRTLLLAVTVAAVAMLAYRTYVDPYVQQRRAMQVIEELKGSYQSSGPTAWQRRLFGEDHQNLVLVNLADCDEPDRYVPYLARLPAIEALVVGGEAFGDDHLGRLSGLDTLRGLVLDSTSVTDEALAAWRERLPEAEVYRSQRRAVAQLRSLRWQVASRVPPSGPVARQSGPRGLLDEWVDAELIFEAEVAVAQAADDAALAPLRHLTTLRWLSLAKSKVSDAGLRHLHGLPHLEYLDLEGTPITPAGLAELRPLGNLVYLDLTGTPVTDEGLVHLRALPNLGWLKLSRTRVTYAGVLEHVVPIRSLRMLYIQETRIAPEEAEDLDQRLRPCFVFGLR